MSKFNVRRLTSAEFLEIRNLVVHVGSVEILRALSQLVAGQHLDDVNRGEYYRDQLLRLARELDTEEST